MPSSANQRPIIDYGFTQALQQVFPTPIVAKRAPTTSDKAQLGTLWVQPTNTSGTAVNSCWVLTSIISNSATWSDISGGAGSFTTLTVNPGPTNLSTVGNGAVSIGNATNTGAITLSVGTGNLAINGNGHTVDIANDAAANTVVLGSTTNGATTTIAGGNGTGLGTAAVQVGAAAAGDIQVGLTTMTGTLYLGNSTAGNHVSLGTGAAANVITIGSSTAGNITNLASAITSLPGPVYVYTGAGAPGNGLALHVGDLYINTTAATAATRMYIATGVGAWTNVTCAA